MPAAYTDAARERGVSVHQHLSELGAEQDVGEHGLVALDWMGGNRSVLVDHTLSGAVFGLTLSTTAPQIYRALQEATAFGTRTIIEAFEGAGLPVDRIVVAGGLLQNPLLMQLYADVTQRPLDILGSEQGPALGSAIHAAVAAGCHPDIHAAAAAMGTVERDVYAARRRPGARLRPAVRRVRRAARPLRPRRQRRAAAPAPQPPRGAGADDRRSTTSAATVSELHQELVRNQLVAWTSGNLSARVPGEDLVVIKPSGVPSKS